MKDARRATPVLRRPEAERPLGDRMPGGEEDQEGEEDDGRPDRTHTPPQEQPRSHDLAEQYRGGRSPKVRLLAQPALSTTT